VHSPVAVNGTSPSFVRVAGLTTTLTLKLLRSLLYKVKAAIKKLKLDGASGPDGLTARLLKELADSLAKPQSPMFTSFMSFIRSA